MTFLKSGWGTRVTSRKGPIMAGMKLSLCSPGGETQFDTEVRLSSYSWTRQNVHVRGNLDNSPKQTCFSEIGRANSVELKPFSSLVEEQRTFVVVLASKKLNEATSRGTSNRPKIHLNAADVIKNHRHGTIKGSRKNKGNHTKQTWSINLVAIETNSFGDKKAQVQRGKKEFLFVSHKLQELWRAIIIKRQVNVLERYLWRTTARSQIEQSYSLCTRPQQSIWTTHTEAITSPKFCHMLKISQPIITLMSPYLHEIISQLWMCAHRKANTESRWAEQLVE